jgi:hypothetical protein
LYKEAAQESIVAIAIEITTMINKLVFFKSFSIIFPPLKYTLV